MMRAPPNQPHALPPLRQDLEVRLGASSAAGDPMWIICDTFRHKFIQVDDETRLLLSVWKEAASLDALITLANEKYGLNVDKSSAVQVMEFVRRHHLTEESSDEEWKRLMKEAEAARYSIPKQLIHNYLFFQVPLFKPNRFLKASLPIVAPLYSGVAAGLIVSLGILGSFLVSRQWDTFVATVPDFLSLEGGVALFLTLTVVKILHELGHAYTAVRFGCRVPVMGVAFMLLAPMLYTDVSDAWRLADRKKRLLIDLAGVIVELGIACIATFAWAFLPEGMLRSIAFLLATTAWIMSVGINLNPFMRFDGYYVLCDLVGIDNLQQRAFAFGQWRLRRLLFSPGLPPPEIQSPGMRRFLIIYAWLTWLYRLVVYTGIAVLVYAYFFKLLGVVLFVFEIWMFIARPVLHEVMEWWKLRHSMLLTRRSLLTLAVFVGACAFCVVPQPSTVFVPASLESRNVASIYPPGPARVESVHASRGQSLKSGDLIVGLVSPELDYELLMTEEQIRGITLRLDRISADIDDRNDSLVLKHQLYSLYAKRDGLLVEKDLLSVRMPVDGTVLEIDADIKPGLWVSKTSVIALVGPQTALQVKGYASETDVSSISLGGVGYFIADDLMQMPLKVRLESIGRASAAIIQIPQLATVFGGAVAATAESGQIVPSRTYYPVEMSVDAAGAALPPQVVRGVVRMKGAQRSLVKRAFNAVASVLIRESGL